MPKNFGQFSGRLTARYVELKQAVLGVYVALGVEEVVERLGRNIRYAKCVARDRDLRCYAYLYAARRLCLAAKR